MARTMLDYQAHWLTKSEDLQLQCLVTHLGNYINTSLTHLTFCGTTSQQQDSDSDIFHDGDNWRIFGGNLGADTLDNDDQLDIIFDGEGGADEDIQVAYLYNK
jgi:hypothetical protein